MTNKLSLDDIHAALKEQKFSSFDDWVDTATRKLAWQARDKNLRVKIITPPEQERAICYDTKGRRCFIGRDFHTARDEGTFPVHYIWPDQIIALALLTPLIASVITVSEKEHFKGVIANAHS